MTGPGPAGGDPDRTAPDGTVTGNDAADAEVVDGEVLDGEVLDAEVLDAELTHAEVTDAVPAEGSDLDEELAAMTAEDALSTAERQRDEYLDALRHLQADFENFKKRSAKQQADATVRGAEGLVDKLLPALDTADLAVAHGGGEEVRQVWTTLLDALSREGLERIAPDGGPFDPTRHDAVMHEPGDGSEQAVAEVLRAGYAWKGKVLRPAMVKVRG